MSELVAEYVVAEQPAAELTTAESAELRAAEAVIKRGLESFLDVGRALMAIRDAKLYRSTHGTFEDYVGERWGISRSYAHRTISAAQVVENLLPIGNILPANESQARPLTKLEPDQQVEVWADAVEDSGGKPTQAHVEKAVAKFTEPKPPAPPREVKRVRPDARKPEPTPTRAVYVEPVADDEVIAMLVKGETDSDAFRQTLLDATVEQLAAAMRKLKPDADKWRYVKIGNRRELLLSAHAVTATAAEPTPMPKLRDEVGFDGRTRREVTIARLVTIPPHDGNFKLALDEAPADELIAALGKIPAQGNKTKLQRIDARLRRLAKIDPAARVELANADVHTRDHYLVPQSGGYCEAVPNGLAVSYGPTINRYEAVTQGLLADPDAPTMPATSIPVGFHPGEDFDELNAAGYRLISVGRGMWAIVHEASGFESAWAFDPADCIPQAARHHADEQAANAAVAAPLHPDPIIAALIDPATSITTVEAGSLHATIQQADATQLNSALALMPDELRAGRGPVLEAALKKRGGVLAMMAEKRADAAIDPRLVKAKAGITMLVNTRAWAQAEYGELVGKHTDMLEFERGTERMLERLQSLVDVLTKGATE